MKSKPRPEWMLNPPRSLIEKVRLIHSRRHLLDSPGLKGKFLRNLLKEVNAMYKRGVQKVKALQPLAWFKPSYEQSLILNCWVYGIAFIGIYCANRIGKTTACFLNFILWIYPNNPKWKIFRPYKVGEAPYDLENHDNPNKGKLVQVLPRPNIYILEQVMQARERYLASSHPPPPEPNPRENFEHPVNKRYLQWLQKEVPEAFENPYPDAPWDQGGECWFGAPGLKHHKKVIMPLWRKLLPAQSVERFVASEQEITLKITTPTGRFTHWELLGKSYDQEDTTWSSGAVDAILLTEGVTPSIFSEVKARFKDPGIGSHDFTPYEPSNVGPATALAKRILMGKEHPPLPTFCFTEFDVYSAPRQVMSDRKKAGLIKSYKGTKEEDARLKGKFYASSMLILSKLDRKIHLLPFSVEEMFAMWPNGRIYRGLDPGLDHPTACAWVYILPSNVKIVYRILAEPGLTIPERCKKIVEMSKNKLARKYWGPGPRDYYFVETHPNKDSEIVCATAIDYHTFKTDEETGSSYVMKYQVGGLAVVESIHIDQEERAVSLNSDLDISEFVSHPIYRKPPSPKVFFLQYGEGIMETMERWEEFYWDRIRHGDNKGMPKDKVPDHGDDELDAVSYVTASNYCWTKWRPSATFVEDSEPDEAVMQASMSMTNLPNRSEDFAMIAKPTPREVVVFGQNTMNQ